MGPKSILRSRNEPLSIKKGATTARPKAFPYPWLTEEFDAVGAAAQGVLPPPPEKLGGGVMPGQWLTQKFKAIPETPQFQE